MNQKPLFIPLKAEYYDAFECGDKTVEYRAYGPRWNERVCYAGRPVILSRGYGKRHRLLAEIKGAGLETPTRAFHIIYGEGKKCYAIYLGNIRKQPANTSEAESGE